MTAGQQFEQDLPALLTDLGMPVVPSYRDDIVRQIEASSQRPAWTFPERWIPMDTVLRRLPVAPINWRMLALAALLVVAVVAIAILAAGADPRLPAPFGPAANGSILFALDGDIYTADPVTGVTKAIVTGPETDSAPIYSLDGSRVLFGRKLATDQGNTMLFVGREDGGGLVQVTPEPLRDLSGWSFSPDGRSIVAFALGERGWSIVILPSDGSGQPKFFPVFATRSDGAPQHRPDGSEIMFIGKDPGAAMRGVYALDPATGRVRTVIAPRPPFDISGAAWSPDGTKIAYGMHDTRMDTVSIRTHVANADGTGDITADTHPDSIADGGFEWSNDGSRLIITRFYSDDGSVPARSVIVPIDRSSPGVEIACPAGSPADDCSASWSWSPDDTVLLGTVDAPRAGKTQFLADPATGQIRDAPWTAEGDPAWQRLAP